MYDIFQVKFFCFVLFLKIHNLFFVLESHTAINIASYFEKLLSDYELDDKVWCFVTDSGANLIAAIKILNNSLKKQYIRLPCSAHQLNLVVNELFPFKKTKDQIEEEEGIFRENEEGIPQEIEKARNEKEKLFNLLIKVRKIVCAFTRSSNGTSILKEKLVSANSKIQKIKKPNITRWNSFYNCIKRLFDYFYYIFF